MELQTASDQAAFVDHAARTGVVNSAEDSPEKVQALCEERERRRVQFRSSLLQARNYLSQAAKALSGCVPAESR